MFFTDAHLLTCLAVGVLVAVAYVLRDLIVLLATQYLSPLRALRSPPSPSFLFGNLREMYQQENTGLLFDWEDAYGHTYAYRGFLGGYRLITTDLTVITHILAHPERFQKPDFVRENLAAMGAGSESVLTTEGNVHARQRRILAPAFTAAHIRTLHPIFWDKAAELLERWTHLANDRMELCPSIDVLPWLSKATLDVIGLAGFGYQFNALAGENDELADAYHLIFSTARKLALRTILETWIPLLRKFRPQSEAMNWARAHLTRIGLKLIEERKSMMAAEMGKDGPYQNLPEYLRQTRLRDLLSVLVQSNMASFASQRMTTPEVLCQISTFLIAGYETTASALTWCLYALAHNPAAQHRLRAALWTIPRDSPTLDEDVAKLEQLDWVVREALRLHAPVTWTMRVAMKVDNVPVDDPFTDRWGAVRNSVRVNQGDIITVPIQAINKSKKIWGEDAQSFRPDRWRNPPESIKSGLWSNMLTFLGGSRGCIGYRFALAEIKIFLYTLVRNLEFSADEGVVIEKVFNIVARPIAKPANPGTTTPANTGPTTTSASPPNMMPLLIRPVGAFNDTGDAADFPDGNHGEMPLF
ncbi:cytochrome P450 [Pisolithus tinctorius]|nr:cytochrome P450 [Pisolithus tinctorius]